MGKPTIIYVVRHAESHSNALKKFTKNKAFHDFEGLGTSLTPDGKQQVNKLAEKLKDVHFDKIFSSDMVRAKETAEILALERKLAVETTNKIRENSFFGYIHKLGRPYEEVEKEMLTDLAKLDELGKMNYKHTSAVESPSEAATRLLTYIREIAVAYAGKTIMLVAHGNLMRSLLTHLGFAKYNELPAGTVKNAAYFVLESDGVNFFIKETHGVEKQQDVFRTF